MRKLTIKRKKSSVACLARMKVYIECPTGYETVIGGVPCRKLGTLKNGEEFTCEIPEDALKIFVIADKLSKNFSNDYYQLPEGAEDVFLQGQNKYNPLNGNAFRFDGVADESVKKNRKRGIIIGSTILIIAFIVGVILGVAKALFASSDPRTFAYGNFEITLTEAFSEISDEEGYDVCYSDGECAIFVFTDVFEEWESFEEFKYLIEYIGVDEEWIVYEDDLTYCEYVGESDSGIECYYLTAVFKTDDGFVVFDFGVDEDSAESYYELFPEFARSIEFN